MAKGDCFIGVDVGAPRKGFDVAVYRDGAIESFHKFKGGNQVPALVEMIHSLGSKVVAIDSPQNWAPVEKSRPCERAFVKMGICGIRFTPNRRTADSSSNGYYGWIFNGMKLWEALDPAASKGAKVIEVFPTAAWTVWFGSRGTRRRAAWSERCLKGLDIELPEVRRNQDKRDAVAAALTACEYSNGEAEAVSDGDDRHPNSAESGIVLPSKSRGST